MKPFYFFGISSITLVFLIGWMLNCSGISSSFTTDFTPNYSNTTIISSDWISANQWVSTNVFGMPARSCELYHKNLTNSLLDNNQLYVYSQIDNSSVHVIPYTINDGSTELRYDYTIPKASTLRIVAIGLKGTLRPAGTQKYRCLLVPNDLAKKLSINMDDYEAVKTAFKLED
ncbi:MAG: hypothetical protein R2822_00995 [Spirosomataceae bacterium]